MWSEIRWRDAAARAPAGSVRGPARGRCRLLLRKEPEHRFLGVADQALQALASHDELRAAARQPVLEKTRIAQQLDVPADGRLRALEMVPDLGHRGRVLRAPPEDP